MSYRLCSAKKLKVCRLWAGSMLELEFNTGGLQLDSLKKKAELLHTCDDKTPAEDELLKALLETIADNE